MTAEGRPSRTVEIIADTVGDTITPTVTGALAAAAVVTGNPDLGFLAVPIGAMTGALGNQTAQLVIGALRDRAERVRRLIDDVAAETGTPFEDFTAEHIDSDPKRRLLGTIVAAATDATSAERIRTLARAFVRGARDEARIDETLYFVKLVLPLDPAHARFLAAVAGRHERGIVRVTYDDVRTDDPGIGLATPLLGDELLDRKFLAVLSGEPAPVFKITAVGLACATWLAELGEPASPVTPVTPGSPGSPVSPGANDADDAPGG